MSHMFTSFLSTVKKPFWPGIYFRSKSNGFKPSASTCGIITHSIRTHNCAELRLSNVNANVTLCGWVKRKRMQQFVLIGDSFGTTQLIIDNEKMEHDFGRESLIKVSGIVKSRPSGLENPKMQTGEIEVIVSSVDVLNDVKSELNIPMDDYSQPHESSLMKYRYLHLRKGDMQRNLRFRSDFSALCREFLVEKHGFVEVETPLLFKKTSGGAKEFLVPTRNRNEFYALPQSPQLMKQLLMVGGVDRYFQFARCFRDETTTKDRQPEFTQIDVEMSFVEPKGVMKLIEDMIHHVLGNLLEMNNFSFLKMTHREAMSSYGTDKPDLRYDFKITNVSHVKELFHLFGKPKGQKNWSWSSLVIGPFHSSLINFKSLKDQLRSKNETNFIVLRNDAQNGLTGAPLTDMDKEYKKTLADKLGLQIGEACFISGGPDYTSETLLGKFRTNIIEILDSLDPKVSPNRVLRFVWVFDFPLFERNYEGEICASHHPFTSPHPEDLDLLNYKDFLQVRGLQYDLVLNGQEVGGGSIRIHDVKMQRRIYSEFLKLDAREIPEFFRALECGCPPHGGIALGLDRLLAVILNVNSIRDVIAFPKSSDGTDPLFNCPTTIRNEDLAFYHLDQQIDT